MLRWTLGCTCLFQIWFPRCVCVILTPFSLFWIFEFLQKDCSCTFHVRDKQNNMWNQSGCHPSSNLDHLSELWQLTLSKWGNNTLLILMSWALDKLQPLFLSTYLIPYMCRVLNHFSHVQLSAALWAAGSTRFLCPWDSPGKNTGVGCHALLQGIFPTQGLKSCLLYILHWQPGYLPLAAPHYLLNLLPCWTVIAAL